MNVSGLTFISHAEGAKSAEEVVNVEGLMFRGEWNLKWGTGK
jgi:hypothetical protein